MDLNIKVSCFSPAFSVGMLTALWTLWSLYSKISQRWINSGSGCSIRLVENWKTVTYYRVWLCMIHQVMHALEVKMNCMGINCGNADLLWLLIIHTGRWCWIQAWNWAFSSAGTCSGERETGERKKRASGSCNTVTWNLLPALVW